MITITTNTATPSIQTSQADKTNRGAPAPAAQASIGSEAQSARVGDDARVEIVAAYRDGDSSLEQIAQKFNTSPSTVVARSKGCLHRKRGRPRHSKPSPRQQKMLRLIGKKSFSSIGKDYGCSKQYIHGLKKRWSGWLTERNRDIGQDNDQTSTACQGTRRVIPCIRIMDGGVHALSTVRTQHPRVDNAQSHRVDLSVSEGRVTE